MLSIKLDSDVHQRLKIFVAPTGWTFSQAVAILLAYWESDHPQQRAPVLYRELLKELGLESPLKTVKIEDEVHRRLAVYRVSRDLKTFSLAIDDLLHHCEKGRIAPSPEDDPPFQDTRLVEDPFDD